MFFLFSYAEELLWKIAISEKGVQCLFHFYCVFQLENEIRRVASQDPRLILNTVRAFPQENGILLEVEMAVTPFNQANLLSVFFNSATNIAVLQ